MPISAFNAIYILAAVYVLSKSWLGSGKNRDSQALGIVFLTPLVGVVLTQFWNDSAQETEIIYNERLWTSIAISVTLDLFYLCVITKSMFEIRFVSNLRNARAVGAKAISALALIFSAVFVVVGKNIDTGKCQREIQEVCLDYFILGSRKDGLFNELIFLTLLASGPVVVLIYLIARVLTAKQAT